jgi:hypothetical protein
VALCLLLLPPFFCGGLATGLILTVHVHHAGRYYASSLVGSGLGGLLGLACVAQIDPPRLPSTTAAIGLAGTLCLLRSRNSGRHKSNHESIESVASSRVPSWTIAIIACITGVYLATLWFSPMELRPSQFKPLSRTLELPDAEIRADAPSVHGWIQIVNAPALRPSPAVSFAFEGEIPPHPAVFINGLGYGSLPTPESISQMPWLDFTTDAAVFAPLKPHKVLLLENGPGGWSTLASLRGAERVTVTEPNHALVDLLTQGDRPLAPEWRLPSVHLVTASGRAFLRRSSETFDVIRFPSVGELGGGAGLSSTSEQFLLTREAFSDAWVRLSPTGIIAVTAWMDFPERNSLRLLATLVETAESVGVPARSHLAAIRGWATVTFLLRRNAWSTADVSALRKFAEDRGFDPLLLPDLRADERERYHAWQNPDFFPVVDHIVDGPRDAVYREHPFSLRPTTDDRPYFSQFFRWSARDQIVTAFGARTMPFFELGSLTVALTFLALSVLAVSGIVLPLTRLGWRTSGKTNVLFYFGGLGSGYMFVEVGLLLSAHAWLGSPVFAAAAVLTVLLAASGIGSVWSERWNAGPAEQKRTLLLIITGIIGLALLFFMLGPVARTWPLLIQLTLLICLIAPVGIVMGMAFPLGLRRIETVNSTQVPWAWAINGCISVATPAAAMLLAMSAGFSALFGAAAIAYGVALAAVVLAARNLDPD